MSGKKALDYFKPEIILDSISDGVYVTDTHRVISYWNRGAEKISGFKCEEVLGKSCMQNILKHRNLQGMELCNVDCPLSLAMKEDRIVAKELVFFTNRFGIEKVVQISCSPVHDEKGKVVGGVEVFRDISDEYHLQKEREHLLAKLSELTVTDELTGLFNRRKFNLELEAFFTRHQRVGEIFGLLILDIDHFKKVNDTFGHQTGDMVLRRLSKTLKENLRSIDLAFRYGGEEFAVLLPGVNLDELKFVADRLRQAVKKIKDWVMNTELKITISVGGVLADEADTVTRLIELADQRLYQAKNTGRNKVIC